MRPERISAWILALLVAVAAVAKLVRLEATSRDTAELLTAAGIAPPPGGGLELAIWAVAALEIALAVVIGLSRRSRIGLVALLVLMSAGVLLVGAATSWGGDADVACPCGLPLELPFLRNAFAAMLARDALLVALVALAWGPRTPAGAGGEIARGPEARSGAAV